MLLILFCFNSPFLLLPSGLSTFAFFWLSHLCLGLLGESPAFCSQPYNFCLKPLLCLGLSNLCFWLCNAKGKRSDLCFCFWLPLRFGFRNLCFWLPLLLALHTCFLLTLLLAQAGRLYKATPQKEKGNATVAFLCFLLRTFACDYPLLLATAGRSYKATLQKSKRQLSLCSFCLLLAGLLRPACLAQRKGCISISPQENNS